MAKKPRRQYLKNGKKLPSVTEILQGIGWKYAHLMGWANKVGRELGITTQAATKDAMDIGSCAHDMIEAWLLDESILVYASGDDARNFESLKPSDYRQEIWDAALPALHAFNDWYESENMRERMNIISTEKLMMDVNGRFGGTADLIAEIDGNVYVIDYKTGSGIYPEVAVQLEAYAMLFEQNPENPRVHGTAVIHCPPNAETVAVDLTDYRGTALAIWNHLLAMNSHKSDYEKLGKMLKAKAAKPADDGSQNDKIPF